MKVLVDMNLSPRWTRFLADAGLEAVHWSDLGAGDAPDAEIMAFAKAHDYVVFTHDLDFSAILAATHGEKPSVVQLRSEDVSPEAVGQAVVAAVRQTADDLARGALLTVEPSRMRLRLLPLQPG
jgi:predicted nuclease of predicted toxin-antitoxin system